MEKRILRWLSFSVIGIFACALLARAGEPGFDDLAKTPPMGWNSWNKFACNVSEKLIKETAETKEILANKEVIAVDQDPLGIQGRKVADGGAVEVWMKPLRGAARAVILFNRGSAPAPISVSWEQIGLSLNVEAQVRDLWARKDLGAFKGRFMGMVEPHGVVMIRVQP